MRRAVPALAAGLLVAAGSLVALPAQAAAPVRSVQVALADPLMTDPVQVAVVAVGADGDAVPFSGTVTLTTGRTSTTVAVTGDGADPAEVDVPTTGLSGGSATVHVAVRGGGGTAVSTVPRFTEVPVAFAVGGFGCSALTSRGGDVHFAVTVLNGAPVPHPASTGTWQIAYRTLSNGPLRMVDGDGTPLPTTGRLTLRRGSRTIGVVALPRAVRSTVFAVHWGGGAAPAGGATATLVLTDANGRSATATVPVHLVRSGTMPCA